MAKSKYWEEEVPVETQITERVSIRVYPEARVLQFCTWSRRMPEFPTKIFALHIGEMIPEQLELLQETVTDAIVGEFVEVPVADSTS